MSVEAAFAETLRAFDLVPQGIPEIGASCAYSRGFKAGFRREKRRSPGRGFSVERIAWFKQGYATGWNVRDVWDALWNVAAAERAEKGGA